jgi:DNA-directed RNA polymerase subunit RPC12/RpoP
MNINSLTWAKCPHCKVELNGWDFYPANVVQNNDGYGKLMKCVNCGKKIAVNMRVEVTLAADKGED